MSPDSDDFEGRDRRGRRGRCHRPFRHQKGEGGVASSPREKVASDASPRERVSPRRGDEHLPPRDWVLAARGEGVLLPGPRGRTTTGFGPADLACASRSREPAAPLPEYHF